SRLIRMEVNDSVIVVGPFDRGVTILVVDSTSGKVLDHKRFDTWASTQASIDLSNYCTTIPAGMFVMMGVCDDAVTQLTDTARAAIRGLGATKFDQLQRGDGWAFVCRAG